MTHYAMQANTLAASRDYLAAGDRKSAVICPKPRRLSPLPASRPIRWQSSHQAEPCSSKPGLEFLDYFLSKGGESSPMSPPFFCGSPPSRAGNPVVHDARFGENRTAGTHPSPLPALSGGSAAASPMSPRSSSNCARKNIGLNPATVRIEGFDCLDGGGRRGCGITAVA